MPIGHPILSTQPGASLRRLKTVIPLTALCVGILTLATSEAATPQESSAMQRNCYSSDIVASLEDGYVTYTEVTLVEQRVTADGIRCIYQPIPQPSSLQVKGL